MNIFQELYQRRVFQYTGMYFGFGFGVMTILDYLREEMVISPYLARLILLALVLLLPSVVILSWVHGQPGKDSWGRIPKLVIPANLIAIALLLILKFGGQDLGPVVQTIEVADETGAVTERVVPKASFVQRVFIFYPENKGSAEDDWARETISYLQFIDLCQDAFVGTWLPGAMRLKLQEAGYQDGHGLPRSLQRKLARDVHVPHFLTGTISHEANLWTLDTELHESDSGRVVATRSFESTDLLILVDKSTRQLREDLAIPSAHLKENQDLPVSEITSTDLQAVREYVLGQVARAHHNDYESSREYLEAAVERDPGFAWAHMRLASIYQTIGLQDRGTEAVTAAMENLYRLPERIGFAVKSMYYNIAKQDPDKQLAVVQMWNKIYPNDIDAYDSLANLYALREDFPRATAAYEKILEIDPTRTRYLLNLAGFHAIGGDTDAAEECLRRYVELFPTDTEGHQGLANLLTKVGRLDEARQSLETISLLDPEDLDAALGVIYLDIMLGNYSESRRALENLANDADTAPKRGQIFGVQIELATMTGQTEVLIRTMDEYRLGAGEYLNPIMLAINYSTMLNMVAKLGRPDEALRRFAEIEYGQVPALDSIMKLMKTGILIELGRLDEGEALLEETRIAFAQGGMNLLASVVPVVEGEIAERRGDLDTAVAKYQEASGLMMEFDPGLKVRLAHVLHEIGESDKALKHLAEARKHQPAHPEAHLELARIMMHKGDFAQAREHLLLVQKAWAEAHPDFPLLAELENLKRSIQ